MDIFSLLKVTIVDVFTNWIEVKDLVHLDSAFCNSTSRCLLLGLFEQEYFTLSENSISTECLKYVSGRKLKLKTLSLNDSFGSRQLIHDLTTSKVRSLMIIGSKQWKLSRADLVSLFNACSMLSELVLDGVQSCCDDVIVQFNPTILSRLASISIKTQGCGHFTEFSIQHLNAHCFLLESIQFSFASQRINHSGMLKLVDINLHLTDLNLNWKILWDDSECVISWASSCVLQNISLVFELPWSATGQFCKVNMSRSISAADNKNNISVAFNTNQNHDLSVSEMLVRFADLPCIVAGKLYLSPNYALNALQTMMQRAPSELDQHNRARFADLPDDIRYLFANFPKLTYLSSVGGDPRESCFDISPITPDSDSLKLQVSNNDMLSYCNPIGMLSQLIHIIPRLKQVELPNNNIRNADRGIIETACRVRGQSWFGCR